VTESVVDEIAPSKLAQSKLVLELDSTIAPTDVLVGSVVLVSVNYDGASNDDPDLDLGGVVLPLIYTVTQPDGSKIIRRTFDLVVPRRLSFQPELPGKHLVRLGEAFHNRTWGSVIIEVLGGQTGV
jgi:hypothetical protein